MTTHTPEMEEAPGYLMTEGEHQLMREEDEDRELKLTRQRDELLSALSMVLPLAEAYLRKAPDHPDNAKLETARAAIAKAQQS